MTTEQTTNRNPLLTIPLFVALLLALAFLAFSPAVGASPAERSGNFPPIIDLPNGTLPEGIEHGPGTSFFVGSLLDGTILQGDFRTGSSAVFVAATPGSAAAGIAYEARHDRIWVAGGGPQLIGNGDLRVYDASSGALLATYQPPGVGLLNDVAVTRDAVYVTDSGFPQLVVIPLGPDGSLPPPSAATFLPVGGDMLQAPGINLNGIVAKNGVLLVANSTTGKLFRVDPATGVAHKLDLGGADLSYPDGLELLGRHKLYVVRPFDNRVTLISLRAGLTSGVVLGHLTDPSLDIPSTATVAAGRLWAVNLRFTTPVTPDTPYWITQLPLRP
jgi:sugar lactone lactonase YvrE